MGLAVRFIFAIFVKIKPRDTMNMELKISNFGPIKDANINLGNLTFLIGPQASGKSLSLELLKLIIDKQHIVSTLRNYNYILHKTDAKIYWNAISEKVCPDFLRKTQKFPGRVLLSRLKIC